MSDSGFRPSSLGEDQDTTTVMQRVSTKSKKKKSKKVSKRTATVDGVVFSSAPKDLAKKLRTRLAEAGEAFEAERFADADRLLKSISGLAPGVTEVHELHGLTYYRLGRWKKALVELEAFSEKTSSVEQHPVIADCYRALRQWNDADQIWKELGAASPSVALIEEGRIVQAGVLSDRGRFKEAIRFLEKAPVPKKPSVFHLRRWYVLAGLYERAGDNSRARRILKKILSIDSNFGDTAERLASLE